MALGGTLFVTSVISSLGFVEAGEHILVEGTGFQPGMDAAIEGVATSATRVVSGEWIELVALAPADLTARRLRVDGREYFIMWQAPAAAAARRRWIPMFRPQGQTVVTPAAGFGPLTQPVLSVRNPGRVAARVWLEEVNPGWNEVQTEFTVEPGEEVVCGCSVPRMYSAKLIASQSVQFFTVTTSRIPGTATGVSLPGNSEIPPRELVLSSQSTEASWIPDAAFPEPVEIGMRPEREPSVGITIQTEFANGAAWFRATGPPVASGIFPGTKLTVTFTPQKDMPPGVYRGLVRLTPVPDPVRRPVVVPAFLEVRLVVSGGPPLRPATCLETPAMTAEPSALDVTLPEGDAAVTRTIRVAGLTGTAKVSWSVRGVGWFFPWPEELRGESAVVNLQISPRLPPGIYTGVVFIEGSSSLALPLTLRITPSPKGPRWTLGEGVGTPAPWRIVGEVAPGATLTIHGSPLGENSPRADGLRVTFDGMPATVRGQSATHIEVDVPGAVAGRAFTMLEVEWFGLRSRPWGLPVTSSSPRASAGALRGNVTGPPETANGRREGKHA